MKKLRKKLLKTIAFGKLCGVPVKIHWSLFLLVLVSWYFLGFPITLGILFSIIAHELGHAFVAKRVGIEVEHMTLTGFGGFVQMYAPIDLHPKKHFAMASAGVLTNLTIALVAFVLYLSPYNSSIENYFLQICGVNIVLFITNTIPAYPLDGGVMLQSLLSLKKREIIAKKITAIVGIVSSFILLGLLIAVKNYFEGILVFLFFLLWNARSLILFKRELCYK